MSRRQHASQPTPNYEFWVRGHLGSTMLAAFPALKAETQSRNTVLRGALADQAALYGVLAQLEGLGLELLEVRQVGPERSDRLPADRPDGPE